MTRALPLLAIVVAAAMLAACGNKGRLVLPDQQQKQAPAEKPADRPAPAAAPAAAKAPATNASR